MDKSSNSDEFNLNFFNECWEVVSYDVLPFVNEFHYKAKIPKVVSTSFLALIPINPNPQNFNKDMPIIIIRSLYRLLSKLLASSLKTVMNKLI